MIKKLISTLNIILLLGSTTISGVSADSNIAFRALDLTGGIGFDSQLTEPQQFAVKNGGSYNEAKDPALRRGTENWEEPQGSFFAIPAVVVGIIALFLFFNREK
jgi:hypothetical protein